MKGFIGCFMLVGATLGLPTAPSTSEERSFSLFSVVSFQNRECQVASDTTTKGTCYSSTECEDKGGTKDGNCASGFGVCCSFTISATTATVSKNCSYVQNSGYPSTISTASTTYTYTVTPEDQGICQLRLDFTNFVTAITATTGACSDTFTVTSPTSKSPPVVCGTLTGMHMYVETAASTTSTTMAMVTSSSDSTTNRSWKVKVSFIECSSKYKAPADCVQYFTGSSGVFQSYNFDGGLLSQSQSASYCFRQEVGYCSIDYSTDESSTSPDPFLLSAITTVEVESCSIARVNIPYFGFVCGGEFGQIEGNTDSGTIRQSYPPFAVHVSVLGVSTVSSTGFKLQYNQVPC